MTRTLIALACLLCASRGALGAPAVPAPAPAPPGYLTLTLLSDTLPAAKGGRCMDGSMTGYYYRKGVPDTYVIFIEGGGACSSEGTCKAWAKKAGSNKNMAKQTSGEHYGVSVADCSTNPYFCNATAAVVPYCTADAHRGNNTVASDKTWGWIFDGHLNFVAVIEELIKSRGLGDAKRVLLSGSSAGGIGTLVNLDWLAARLPDADVKGAPTAGWFFPAALPGDLDDVFAPSDYAHFAAGTHGNAASANPDPGSILVLQNSRGVLNQDCVAAQKPDQWWACASAHKHYPFIKTPLYVMENTFDTCQIWSEDGMLPKNPPSSEYETVDSYVEMYGKAMRSSTAQVLNNATKAKKRVPDALFLPSCFQHGVDMSETITPAANGAGAQSWPVLLGDWFFELNQYQQYHRLVESCPTGLPCNPNPVCSYSAEHPLGPTPAPPSGPTPPPAPGGCAAQLTKDGCLPNSASDCEKCAKSHGRDLEAAGCTPDVVQQLCGASAPTPAPATPTPAPAPSGACTAAEQQCCPGLAGTGAQDGGPCYNCVRAHDKTLQAAGCYTAGAGHGRHEFIEAFCGNSSSTTAVRG